MTMSRSFRIAGFIRLLLGIVLLFSAVTKIVRPHAFLDDVLAYDAVGPPVALGIGVFVPWLEALLGILLIGGVAVAGALLITTVLLFVFVGAQISATTRGLDINCGCFGSLLGDDGVSLSSVVRDSALGLVALGGYAIAVARDWGSAPRTAA